MDATSMSPMPVATTEVVIDYTNYRGERALRRVRPLVGGVFFSATEFHPEPQWLLRAIDVAKDAERVFAMRDIHRFDVRD